MVRNKRILVILGLFFMVSLNQAHNFSSTEKSWIQCLRAKPVDEEQAYMVALARLAGKYKLLSKNNRYYLLPTGNKTTPEKKEFDKAVKEFWSVVKRNQCNECQAAEILLSDATKAYVLTQEAIFFGIPNASDIEFFIYQRNGPIR